MKQEQNLPPTRLQNMASFSETFQSSINDKPQKFTVDKSIARAINQNNSSIIVDEHSERLPIGVQLNYSQQVDRVLFEYRLKYDHVKVESSILQNKIKHKKEQLKRLQQEHQKLANHKEQLNKNCQQTQYQSNLFNYQLDQIIFSLDSQKAMQERLKSDILFYKKNIFQLNIELLKKKSQINRNFNHSDRQKKMSFRCRTLLTSVEKTVNKNQIQRMGGLQSVNEVLSTKKQHLLKRKQRGHMFQKSMLEALSQKLPFQKEYLKLLYSNKLLKSMLHFKMQARMKQYQEVSNSFNTIKSNTTVKNVDQFVYKFLNKNQLYGNLLQSISKLQPKISSLEQEKKQLQAQNLHLVSQNQQITQAFKNKNKTKFEEEVSKLESLNHRLQCVNQYRNNCTNWALGNIAMFKGVPRNQIRPKYEYFGNLFGDSLRLILKYITDEEEKQKEEKEEKEEKNISISQQAFKKQLARNKIPATQILMRNVRIKTLGNQSGRQIDQVQYDLVSEKDYLHQARRAIKKQRFAKNKNI